MQVDLERLWGRGRIGIGIVSALLYAGGAKAQCPLGEELFSGVDVCDVLNEIAEAAELDFECGVSREGGVYAIGREQVLRRAGACPGEDAGLDRSQALYCLIREADGERAKIAADLLGLEFAVTTQVDLHRQEPRRRLGRPRRLEGTRSVSLTLFGAESPALELQPLLYEFPSERALPPRRGGRLPVLVAADRAYYAVTDSCSQDWSLRIFDLERDAFTLRFGQSVPYDDSEGDPDLMLSDTPDPRDEDVHDGVFPPSPTVLGIRGSAWTYGIRPESEGGPDTKDSLFVRLTLDVLALVTSGASGPVELFDVILRVGTGYDSYFRAVDEFPDFLDCVQDGQPSIDTDMGSSVGLWSTLTVCAEVPLIGEVCKRFEILDLETGPRGVNPLSRFEVRVGADGDYVDERSEPDPAWRLDDDGDEFVRQCLAAPPVARDPLSSGFSDPETYRSWAGKVRGGVQDSFCLRYVSIPTPAGGEREDFFLCPLHEGVCPACETPEECLASACRPGIVVEREDELPDRDGDLCPDLEDGDPDHAGLDVAPRDGIPDDDTDADGVVAGCDRCPDEANPAARDGCPE
jgi:hypothetical protein